MECMYDRRVLYFGYATTKWFTPVSGRSRRIRVWECWLWNNARSRFTPPDLSKQAARQRRLAGFLLQSHIVTAVRCALTAETFGATNLPRYIMEPDEDEFLFFQYTEDDTGASTLTNMDDEQVTEVLAQFIQRDTEGKVH